MNPFLTKLPILILAPHSRCNCRCVMCDIWKSTETEEIAGADLDRHAADIAALGVEWVIFSGGEPLMHSDLFALCRQLRRLGIRLTVLSTGLLLEKYAPLLVEHVDEVIVSLDGPPEVHNRIRRVDRAFEIMAGGIKEVHRISSSFRISARCTIQRQNFRELAATVDSAKELGLQSVSFLAADLTSRAFNRLQLWPPARQQEVALSATEVAEFEQKVEALQSSHAADLESGFIVESLTKLRRMVHHFRAHLGLEKPVAPRCNAPWISAVLEADGTLRPCFFHEPLGATREQTLAQALNSKRAVEFRRSLNVDENPTCQRCVCSLYRSL